jgi:hypothetical protein
MELVSYEKPRMFRIGIPSGTNGVRDITFLPGVNEVSDADWALLVKHPHVQSLLEEGDLEVVKHVKGENTLKALDEGQALDMVEKTFGVETLKKWMNEDSRKIVTRAIAIKLKTLVQDDRLEAVGLSSLVEHSSKEDSDANGDHFDDQFPRADKPSKAKASKVETVKAPKKRK